MCVSSPNEMSCVCVKWNSEWKKICARKKNEDWDDEKARKKNIDAELELELDSEPITYEIFMILTCYRFNHKLKYFKYALEWAARRKKMLLCAIYTIYFHSLVRLLILFFRFLFFMNIGFATHNIDISWAWWTMKNRDRNRGRVKAI